MRTAVFLDGKLDRRRGQVNALGGLVFLQDDKSKQNFFGGHWRRRQCPAAHRAGRAHRTATRRRRWENNSILGKRHTHPFFRVANLPLHVHSCRRFKANSRNRFSFKAQTPRRSRRRSGSGCRLPLSNWLQPHRHQIQARTILTGGITLSHRSGCPHSPLEFSRRHRRWIRHPKANPRGHPLH